MTTENKAKPEVSIIGTGRLGTALALALAEQGYSIGALVARRRESARRAVALLDVPSRVMALKELVDRPPSDLLMIATRDDQIPRVTDALADLDWDFEGKKPVVLHTSGALSSRRCANSVR